jgi:sulfopyruvate decarboxylase subunit beta
VPMTHDEYFSVLKETWQDELVVCALGTTANAWWSATRNDRTFYMHAAMGFASSFGMGLALGLSSARVWVLDSDGGLAMNLGGLLTMASVRPANLTHVVLNNHGYQTLGGTSLVNSGRTDYAGVAEAAGMDNVTRATTSSMLQDAVVKAREKHHYALVVADVAPAPTSQRFEESPRLPFEGAEMKYRFGREIERSCGVQVFGPGGF